MKPLFCFHKTVADEWRSLCTIIYHQNGKLIKKKPGNFAIYLCYYSFTEFRMPLYCIRRTPARYWIFNASREKVILNWIVLTELQNTMGKFTNLMQGNRSFFVHQPTEWVLLAMKSQTQNALEYGTNITNQETTAHWRATAIWVLS